jgi:hypothetical protein
VLASFIAYAGFLTMLLGGICLLKPLRFLSIHTRFQGLGLLAAGILLAIVGLTSPASETRVATRRTELDAFVPAYQFNEIHSIEIHAPRERVYQALQTVTADEVSLYRTLTWLRRFGHSGGESMLNPAAGAPLLEVAKRSGFLLLAEEPGREIVLGTAVLTPRGFRAKRDPTPEDFKSLQQPGLALAAMGFLVEDAGPGVCLLSTETRIHATDDSALRRFARYWRVIYPGSALLRRSWLRAIKRRAESGS